MQQSRLWEKDAHFRQPGSLVKGTCLVHRIEVSVNVVWLDTLFWPHQNFWFVSSEIFASIFLLRQMQLRGSLIAGHSGLTKHLSADPLQHRVRMWRNTRGCG